MKSNVNVFIAVILVAVLCGGIVWMQSADDEKVGWNIHDSYGEAPAYSGGAAYTNTTFAGPSAGEGGVMTLSPSRSFGRGMSSSYAGAYAVSYSVSPASSPNSLIASSPLTSAPSGAGLYTTSSQTFNSYGGGVNGGTAMSYSQSPIANGRSNSGISNPSLQGGAGVGISPIAYSSARRGDMNAAAGDNPAQMVAENPVMALTNAASAGNGFYGFGSVVDYSGAASYGEYNAMFGGRSNVRGRQNVGEGMSSTYDEWLRWFDQVGWSYGTANGNNYSFSDAQALNAYNAWVATLSDQLPVPSYEEWLSWFMGKDTHTSENGNTYSYVPVGDILPLLLVAFLYVLFVAIKSNALKLLIKSERSE